MRQAVRQQFFGVACSAVRRFPDWSLQRPCSCAHCKGSSSSTTSLPGQSIARCATRSPKRSRVAHNFTADPFCAATPGLHPCALLPHVHLTLSHRHLTLTIACVKENRKHPALDNTGSSPLAQLSLLSYMLMSLLLDGTNSCATRHSKPPQSSHVVPSSLSVHQLASSSIRETIPHKLAGQSALHPACSCPH